MSKPTYPWFELVQGEALAQGDILEQCPVFSPPTDLPYNFDEPGAKSPEFSYEHMDMVIMTQSCDLEQGKAPAIVLCRVLTRADYAEGDFAKLSGWENARKARYPAYHVLRGCEITGFEREPRIVDFRRVYTLPSRFVAARVGSSGQRIRLMPPYREHLAQAFASFFMRIGLPVAIPKFE